jgi:SNF2 family DNA or RNA helicase
VLRLGYNKLQRRTHAFHVCCQKINKHPEYTGGDLEDFQFMGLNWLAYLWSKGENSILADDSGR